MLSIPLACWYNFRAATAVAAAGTGLQQLTHRPVFAVCIAVAAAGFQARYHAKRAMAATQDLVDLAKSKGLSPATLAQAWAASRCAVLCCAVLLTHGVPFTNSEAIDWCKHAYESLWPPALSAVAADHHPHS
mgnify:CR=1 FL=1